MAYAISWIGTQTEEVRIGPTLYKIIPAKKKEDKEKKVLMNKSDAEEFCENANYDPTWNGLEHTVVEVNEKENNERENIQREISGRKFWRENFDIMIERRKNE